jgi:hypothetical protein
MTLPGTLVRSSAVCIREGSSHVNVGMIGTGFIGGILGDALSRAGNHVTYGSRHPDDSKVAEGIEVASIGDAIATADVVVLAVPGAAVAGLVAEHADPLSGKLVIDATNRRGEPAANSRAELPADVRYARAFNTLGGEVMADPHFADGPADMFFSAAGENRVTVTKLIEDVGLRPIYLGEDREDLVDALFRVWIALAMQQGRGRGFALRVIDR